MKRGNAEVMIFVAVAVVAAFGLYFVLLPGQGQAVMMKPYDECVNNCYDRFQGEQVQSCVDGCGTLTPTEPSAAPTGRFAAPEPKSYGGAIRGITDPTSKAFRGRATALPEQACFTCSCMPDPITSADRETAERVCKDHCGGTITDSIAGECR